MISIKIICEGETERKFINELLSPHFEGINISLEEPIMLGGYAKPDRILKDIHNQLIDDVSAYCTTFFDFYGLPKDFPGKQAANTEHTIEGKANIIYQYFTKSLEKYVNEDTLRRFIPYIQMYEFEALLFSDTRKFAEGIFSPHLAVEFQTIRDQFNTPEEINDSPSTAPSKRIVKLVANYRKPTFGLLAAKKIGLDAIRHECQLFDAWLNRLEALKDE